METSKNFYEKVIQRVWEKATIVRGYDAAKYRQDVTGAWIARDQYGKVDPQFKLGWEIDHRRPESEGGSDDLGNLQPLQWENNRSKGNSYPIWKSVITSSGDNNIFYEQSQIES